MFRLSIYTPTGTVFDEDIDFLRASDQTGTFGILSRHTDFLTILNPSVVIIKKGGTERYIAVKGGILSFTDNTARITTNTAVVGERLEELHRIVKERFLREAQKEKILSETIRNIEKGFIKRMIELEKE